MYNLIIIWYNILVIWNNIYIYKKKTQNFVLKDNKKFYIQISVVSVGFLYKKNIKNLQIVLMI